MSRNRNVIRAEALYRRGLLKTLAPRNGSILVTEFPKCGGSWLATLISDTTSIPFPRQKPAKPSRAIFHGHYLSTDMPKKTVVFWRDPRDIVVSWYHHSLFHSDKNHGGFVQQSIEASGITDVDNVRENLPTFIDYMFNRQVTPRFTLADFHDAWSDQPDVCNSSYEALSAEPEAELRRILDHLGHGEITDTAIAAVVQKNSFESQTNRQAGDESKQSYLRKGIVGDWENHFSDEALSLLDHYLGGRENPA